MEPRVNIYGFPHKGLRNGLGKLSFAISSLDPNNSEEVQSVIELAKELSELLGLHLHSEEEFVTPPLEEKVPGSTQHNHDDHEAMEALEHDMMDTIKALESNPNMQTQEEAYQAVNLFIREYFRHMSEEEGDMNKNIWENFSDEDILRWQGQILSKLSPEQFFKWFKYIIPALNPFEQQIMLGGFKENAPSEAYNSTVQALKPFVTEKQFSNIQTI
ncbi:MAG: hypothetical protein RLZZ242_227 [Bacteroidota bacterium]|jgi:hemerythrin-like domain-containing protein